MDELLAFVRGFLAPAPAAAVEAHLDGCAACSEVIAEAARELVGSKPGAPDSGEPDEKVSPELQAGARLGRYTILELVGRGAMGAVYSSFDPELDRRVAIKLLRPEARLRIPRAELQTRLLREAQAMARLVHPNVLAVHDVGTFEDGVFLAMDFVAGGTVRGWLLEKKRSWVEIVEVFRLAGEGLAAAHRAGIVHRDFKPDNVLVDHAGRVLVTDFGLARLTGAGPDEKAREDAGAGKLLALSMTQTGALLGTPAYMAPEQLAGGPADARADVFGFCAALYEALYEAHPFPTESLAALREATAAGRVREPPRSAGVPSHVRRAVLRGLRAAPAERFESMGALLRALTVDPRRRVWRLAAVALAGVLATGGLYAWSRSGEERALACRRGDGRIEGVWNSARQAQVEEAFRDTGVAYAPAVFAAVRTGLDGYVRGWSAARVDACDATLVRHEQSAQLLDRRIDCLDDHLRRLEALIDAFARADATTVQNAAPAVERLGRLSACADRRALAEQAPLPDDPVTRARIAQARAELAQVAALEESGHYREGVERVNALVEAARATGHEPLLAEAALRQGTLQFAASDPEAAAASLTRAAAAAMRGRRDDLAARAESRLVYVLGWGQHRTDDALRWAEHASAAIARSGDDPLLLADLLLARSETFRKAEQPRKAVDEALQALALLEKRPDPPRALLARTLNNIGIAYGGLMDYRQALAYFGRSVALYQQLYGPEHPLTANGQANSATSLTSLGRYQEALALQKEALARRRKALGEDHREVALSYFALDGILTLMGQYEEGAAAGKEALRIQEKVLGSEHPELVYLIDWSAQPLSLAGRLEEALPLFQRALELARRKIGPDEAATAMVMDDLADQLELHARFDEAVALYKQAYPILSRKAPDTADICQALDGLGRDLLRRGQVREATALHRQSLAVYEKVMGPDSVALAGTLLDLGQSLEAAGDVRAASGVLERALGIVEPTQIDPLIVAELRFALARVSWPLDRARARSLAEQASAAAQASPYQRRQLRERTASWLREHTGP